MNGNNQQDPFKVEKKAPLINQGDLGVPFGELHEQKAFGEFLAQQNRAQQSAPREQPVSKPALEKPYSINMAELTGHLKVLTQPLTGSTDAPRITTPKGHMEFMFADLTAKPEKVLDTAEKQWNMALNGIQQAPKKPELSAKQQQINERLQKVQTGIRKYKNHFSKERQINDQTVHRQDVTKKAQEQAQRIGFFTKYGPRRATTEEQNKLLATPYGRLLLREKSKQLRASEKNNKQLKQPPAKQGRQFGGKKKAVDNQRADKTAQEAGTTGGQG
ncbi:MAG: hypothetical protein M3P33_03745 [bacterium]|nr:hypothetical protein [bacterium]